MTLRTTDTTLTDRLKQLFDSVIGRRSFLNLSLGASFLMVAAGTLYPLFRFLWPTQSAAGSATESVVAVPLSEISVGSVKFIRYKNKPTMLLHTKPDEVFALSAACTHLGCIVKWDEVRSMIVCPCHAALFDVQGNVLAGPAPSPLPSIPVKFAGDKILVGEA